MPDFFQKTYGTIIYQHRIILMRNKFQNLGSYDLEEKWSQKERAIPLRSLAGQRSSETCFKM